jgi:hypothetical protein
MSHGTLATPVALLLFNRPDTTERVFEAVAAARPRTLLVVADGPRRDREGEAEACAAARAITDRVDWPCDVRHEYSDVNLGCARRVSTGIDWIFRNVEEAIILEDDCVPHPTFFPFCEQLLQRYRDDERVMVVSGDNLLGGRPAGPWSYWFSRSHHLWGWATWRRAWGRFDLGMSRWPEKRDTDFLASVLGDADLVAFWRRTFDASHAGEIDTWDFAWVFACWLNAGLSAVPAVNLVSNVGFGPNSTHTRESLSWFANLPTRAMAFPLCHPSPVEPSREWDHRDLRVSNKPAVTLARRITARLKRTLIRNLGRSRTAQRNSP